MNILNLEVSNILNIENDGLNFAISNNYLYIRAKRKILKYDLVKMILEKENTILDHDGKARAISVNNKYVFLIDFCDLYIINKYDLTIVKKLHIGNNSSSDLITIRSDDDNVYISMRNGRMVILNISTFSYEIINICDESSWEHQIVNESLFISTTKGKIIKFDKKTNNINKVIELSKSNIYSLYYFDKFLYIASQDSSIKKLSLDKLEVCNVAKKVIYGMSKILGIYEDYLITADGRISFFNKDTLDLEERISFPTGHYNKGIILYNNQLIGSDYHSIYLCNFKIIK